MPNPDQFATDLVAQRKSLMRHAMRLTGARDCAEDLVQDTMVRALECRHQYAPGTNFGGWLFVMMRNLFLGQQRRARVRQFSDDAMAEQIAAPDDAAIGIEVLDAAAAMRALPPAMQEAVMLVSGGYTYGAAAARMACELGTVKSRVSRGRAQLRAAVESGVLREPRFATSAASAAERLLVMAA